MTESCGEFDGAGDASAEPRVVRSVELIREVVDRPGFAFSDNEVLANLRALYGLAAVVEAAKLAFVAELVTRPEAVARSAPGAAAGAGGAAGRRGALTFLTEALKLSGRQANRDLAAAAALASSAPELPRMGQALVDGEVSREHVDVAVSTLRQIPKVLKQKIVGVGEGLGGGVDGSEPPLAGDQALADPTVDPAAAPEVGRDGGCLTGADVIDDLLTRQARLLPPTTIERLGRQIVHRLDPERAERFDADADERRMCAIGTDFVGMGVYRLVLDPVTHLQVRAAIARAAGPRPAGTAVGEDGREVTVTDQRSLGQRQADAVAELILAGDAALRPQTAQDPDPAGADSSQPGSDAGLDLEPAPASGQQSGQESGQESGPASDQESGQQSGPESAPAGGTSFGTLFGTSLGRPASGSTESGTADAGVRPVLRLGPAAEVSVIATLDQLAAAFGADDPAARRAGLARMSLAGVVGTYPGATIAPAVLARLACDSPIRRVVVDDKGAVLHHGRAHRFATAAQKRAMAVRDGGCAIPGCSIPAEWSEAHHIVPWKDGGLTDIDQMVLLCGRHHTAHHAGVYDIEMRNGIPWVRLPSWRDVTRPWLRNTSHDHHRLADSAARRIDPGPPPLWAPGQEPGDAA